MNSHRSIPAVTRDRAFFVYNTATYLLRFRSELISELTRRGFECHAALPDNVTPDEAAALARMGVTVHVVPGFVNQRVTPLADLRLIGQYFRLYRRLRPAIVFNFTIKPCIFSGIAARLARVPKVVATITGLGYAFGDGEGSMRGRLVAWLAGLAYRVALRNQAVVFFQNTEDREYFQRRNIVREKDSRLVNGSGIDTHLFTPVASAPRTPVFLMVARLLKSKGVLEYLEASRITKAVLPEARFVLVGPFDDNPSGISRDVLEPYVEQGIVEYQGYLPDPLPAYQGATIYVLPSYAEGRPRTVLEAMACGLAIITTDARGCREAIEDGVNGYLVAPRSAAALSERMVQLAREPERVAQMGLESRRLAEERYDVRRITETICEVVHGPAQF